MPTRTPPPKPKLPEQRMFSAAEAAHILGVDKRRLKRWTHDGRIRALKPAGERGPTHYSKDEIDRVLKEWAA